MDTRRTIGELPGTCRSVESRRAGSDQFNRATVNYRSRRITIVIGLLTVGAGLPQLYIADAAHWCVGAASRHIPLDSRGPCAERNLAPPYPTVQRLEHRRKLDAADGADGNGHIRCVGYDNHRVLTSRGSLGRSPRVQPRSASLFL